MAAAAAESVERYAVLFGDTNEAGSKIFGKLCDEGFSVAELRTFAAAFGDEATLTLLSDALPDKARTAENEAAVLVVRGGINRLMKDETFADRMLAEQCAIAYDQFAWSRRAGKTQRKHARYNTVFHDQGVAHSDDYREQSIFAYAQVPLLAQLRAALPSVFGD
jgi:hypothetical protein